MLNKTLFQFLEDGETLLVSWSLNDNAIARDNFFSPGLEIEYFIIDGTVGGPYFLSNFRPIFFYFTTPLASDKLE